MSITLDPIATPLSHPQPHLAPCEPKAFLQPVRFGFKAIHSEDQLDDEEQDRLDAEEYSEEDDESEGQSEEANEEEDEENDPEEDAADQALDALEKEIAAEEAKQAQLSS